METSEERKRQWRLENDAKDVQLARDNEYHAAMLQWENTVGVEIQHRWQSRIKEASRKVREAKVIADAVDVAKAESEGQYKPGTVLVGWNNQRAKWSSQDDCQEVCRGVVEVMKPDTVFQKSKTYLPPVGTLLVRLLTKDGKPGKVVQVLGDSMGLKWLPEGKKPK